MRIIGGAFKRKKLIVPKEKSIRPTTDKVKEAVFDSIQFEIKNKTFLDLFSGSGQMGLEALSRGAARAFFIDNNRDSIALIRSNINITSLANRSKIIFSDAFAYLQRSSEFFDIAFLDPPYSMGILNKVLPSLINKMNKDGIIICESSTSDVLPEEIGNFKKIKLRKYGNIAISTFEGES
jgi:16S rRNA (guanine(966)-N(2))-methyltransferase RsmD